mgnify:CR=1 FL=1
MALVTGRALERARADGMIRASLQAKAVVHLDHSAQQMLSTADWAELAIVSDLDISMADLPADAFSLADVPGVAVRIEPASGEKCARCWKVLPEVGRNAVHPGLCVRCVDAVESGLVCKAAG